MIYGPKNITEGFDGLPGKVDAAFVWSGNGKTYFIKGTFYFETAEAMTRNRKYKTRQSRELTISAINLLMSRVMLLVTKPVYER